MPTRAAVLAVLLFVCLIPFAGAQAEPRAQRRGLPADWSRGHLVVTTAASPEALDQAGREPRFRDLWMARAGKPAVQAARAATPARGGGGRKKSPPRANIDWSVSLGSGGVAPGMSPAKYTFDANATPSCNGDFVVYGLDVAGVTNGQANLVGLNNLYSGTAGGNGLCGTGAATVTWAYNTTTVVGGRILTSPAISLDGSKVAFVESAASSAIFHVLTWTAGQGSVSNAFAPAAMNSLTYSPTAGNTRSSVWIDYASSSPGCPCAYVGADDGKLYKILNVFSGTPTLAGAPYPITVNAGQVLTGPVLVYGYIFVGDSVGNLWAVNATTGTLAGSVAVGGNIVGGTTFGVLDPPVIDASATTVAVFATSSSSSVTGGGVLVQAKFDTVAGVFVGAPVYGGVGGGATVANKINLHAPAFDLNYYNGNLSPTTGFIYTCGTQASATQPTLYRFGFTAGTPPTMAAPANGNVRIENVGNVECSPLTEFANPNLATTDLLFVSQSAASGRLYSYNITGAMPAAALATAAAPGGTSGIVVDNVLLTNQQGSSIYFSTLGIGTAAPCLGVKCAVKLTQGALQ